MSLLRETLEQAMTRQDLAEEGLTDIPNFQLTINIHYEHRTARRFHSFAT
jgi:hypothetical protein